MPAETQAHRTERINPRFTPEERAVIEHAAKQDTMQPAAWVRRAALIIARHATRTDAA